MSRFGDPYPDLSLSNDDLRTEVVWKQTWDEARHWSTTVRGYHVRRVDNGEGWFDVDRFGVGGALKYRHRHWEFSGTVRWSVYDYALERASPLDPELRTREDLELEGRIEHKFREHWTVYGVYAYEQTRSNVALDAYRMNTVFAGVEYEF